MEHIGKSNIVTKTLRVGIELKMGLLGGEFSPSSSPHPLVFYNIKVVEPYAFTLLRSQYNPKLPYISE